MTEGTETQASGSPASSDSLGDLGVLGGPETTAKDAKDAKEEETPASPTDTDPAPNGGADPSPAPAADNDVVVQLEKVRVAVPGRVLLEDVDLTIRQGERVLLVGPSGAGKSVLLRLLTGLLPLGGDYEVSGTVRVAGRSVLDRGEVARARESVGIVFQDHALLDELSAAGNLAFARDHATSPGAAEACERAVSFLREHGIEPTARVGNLSGGQKQRVAVARALARDPAIVFYDEPTASLDPRSARAVSSLIAETSESFGKTSIVVTHDYPPFEGGGFRVLLLDAQARALREIPMEDLAEIMAGDGGAAPPPPAPAPTGERLKSGVLDAMAATPDVATSTLKAIPLGLIPVGAKPRWFARWFWHYARIVFAGSAIPYNIIAGVIAGFVATYFTYKFLPRPELTEPLILDDILPALGFALYRIVVPVLVTILVAGRTGAALASDFGNRVYHHQTQAMRSLGAPPRAYLGSAALWASVVGILVVGAIAFWAATLTSLAVFTVIQEELTPHYWNTKFWTKLEPFHYGVVGKGSHWVFAKLLASAVGVCGISYWIGTRPKRTTADVSRGITLSVYWGTVFVLLVHFVCAFFEFQRPLH